jgi:two-component system, LytTR family, sensor kinase
MQWPRASYWGWWALAGAYNVCREAWTMPWPDLLVLNAAFFAGWAWLGLLALPVVRRHPLHWHPGPIALHLLLGAVLAQVDVTLGYAVYAQLLRPHADLALPALARLAFESCFHLGLLTYFGFVAVVQAHDSLRRATASERLAAQMQQALLQAQLQALRQQLQPHFLFNTLHAIGAWMHVDVRTAERMLNRLAELLRMSLRQPQATTVPLGQELEMLRTYLDIEQLRFEDRLRVDWSVGQGLLDSPVPPFVLQPLVENAIRHGIAPHAAGGDIAIRAYRQAQHLLLEVENSGTPADAAGRPAGAAPGGLGIGLPNTRARLRALYGDGQSLDLLCAGCRTLARIRLPLLAPEPVA